MFRVTCQTFYIIMLFGLNFHSFILVANIIQCANLQSQTVWQYFFPFTFPFEEKLSSDNKVLDIAYIQDNNDPFPLINIHFPNNI